MILIKAFIRERVLDKDTTHMLADAMVAHYAKDGFLVPPYPGITLPFVCGDEIHRDVLAWEAAETMVKRHPETFQKPL